MNNLFDNSIEHTIQTITRPLTNGINVEIRETDKFINATELIKSINNYYENLPDEYDKNNKLIKKKKRQFGNWHKSRKDFIDEVKINENNNKIVEICRGHSSWVHEIIAIDIINWGCVSIRAILTEKLAKLLSGDLSLINDVINIHDTINDTTSAVSVNTISNELLEKNKDNKKLEYLLKIKESKLQEKTEIINIQNKEMIQKEMKLIQNGEKINLLKNITNTLTNSEINYKENYEKTLEDNKVLLKNYTELKNKKKDSDNIYDVLLLSLADIKQFHEEYKYTLEENIENSEILLEYGHKIINIESKVETLVKELLNEKTKLLKENTEKKISILSKIKKQKIKKEKKKVEIEFNNGFLPFYIHTQKLENNDIVWSLDQERFNELEIVLSGNTNYYPKLLNLFKDTFIEKIYKKNDEDLYPKNIKVVLNEKENKKIFLNELKKYMEDEIYFSTYIL